VDLFFDYGELLFRYILNKDTVVRAHNLALPEIRRRNSSIGPKELSDAYDVSIQEYLSARKESYEEWPMSKIIARFLEKLDLAENSNGLLGKIENIYKLNDHDAYPKEGIPELLRELHREHFLHIISNLPHDSAIYSLKKYNLRDFFKTITFSYEAGYRKPHEKIYKFAIKRANPNLEKSAFFSHDEQEVLGAIKVGLPAYLVFSAKDVNKIVRELAKAA